MDNKHRTKQPVRQANAKASSSFNLADDFENDLLRATQEQIRKIELDRKNRVNFDKLLVAVIDQVLRCEVNLQPSEVAIAANRILGDLVTAGTVIGTLPSEPRIKAAVRKHLRTRTDSAVGSVISTPTQAAPQTMSQLAPHTPQAEVATQMRSAAEQNRVYE